MAFEWGRAADNFLRAELLPGKVLLTGYAGRKDAACFLQNYRDITNKMHEKDPYWYRQWAPTSVDFPKRLLMRSGEPTQERGTEHLREVKGS